MTDSKAGGWTEGSQILIRPVAVWIPERYVAAFMMKAKNIIIGLKFSDSESLLNL